MHYIQGRFLPETLRTKENFSIFISDISISPSTSQLSGEISSQNASCPRGPEAKALGDCISYCHCPKIFPSQAYKCQPVCFQQRCSEFSCLGLPMGAHGGEPSSSVKTWRVAVVRASACCLSGDHRRLHKEQGQALRGSLQTQCPAGCGGGH